ncbi:uncharacterized protein HMPREF1541_11087 [Cyphellophora europaea CBS 101466]|uniref:Transcription factor domain-containing protein n=1 Tax=Cyphellophora europaea (strain CBS 101466) TaxID=1220924 RepID=W2S6U1_CYPE1|nr:uncharacterized protein HMPREF1541_11087 [Cyphellophora europaea CBS 101466]ETN43763.1 hypothetical protein HMPREF1541_11087 [Cyphellophora europaea CBS 101466]
MCLLAVPITQENVIRAGFGTWPAFFADPIQHRLASQCLLSLSRVYFARHHGSPELINQGTALYVKSLKTLHSALGDVKVRTADDTLFAVMILGLYEMLELSSTDGWIAHALGLGKVIETRGAKSFDGPEQRILFECNRFIIILASLAGNKATFLSLNEWKTEPWASAPESKGLLHYLLDLFADLATLKAETLKSSTTTQLGVRSQISRVMADLLEWRAAWDIINSREVLEVPNPTIDDQAVLPTVLQFNSIHIANDMCLYDACFVQAFRVLKWAGGANDAAYFALNERAALEICQTIDYLQHSAPWMTAQFLVLFPLRMAFLAVEHSPSPLRTWVERKLTMFTTSQQGWGVAKKLHYYGSK